MHRVIDLELNPLIPSTLTGDPKTAGWVLPISVLALPDAAVAVVERTTRGDGQVECSRQCGALVGGFLDERDDGLQARERWAPYSLWGKGEGVFVPLCEDCSHDQKTSAVGGTGNNETYAH